VTHSENATLLVEGFEDCVLIAYKDGNGIWTIGWGHTGAAVVEGLTCTQAQADAWQDEDLAVADAAIARLVKMALNQNQHDALVSLIYNIGQGRFAKSSTLRELNWGNAVAACAAMALWNQVAGKVSNGLVRRRAAEQALFRKAVA